MNQRWVIPSAVFVPSVALQTKFSLSIKFSRNLGSMPKMSSSHVLSTSRKHTIKFPVKSFGEWCGSMMLTTACYWPSSHRILLKGLCPYRRSSIPIVHRVFWTPTAVYAVITPLHSQRKLDRQSQQSWRRCQCRKLQDQPFAFSDYLDGRCNKEIDARIGKANSTAWVLSPCGDKTELLNIAKLSISKGSFFRSSHMVINLSKWLKEYYPKNKRQRCDFAKSSRCDTSPQSVQVWN